VCIQINNITEKLANMTNTTTKLSLTNSNQVDISSLLHDGQNGSRAIIRLVFSHNADGITTRDFTNTKHITIAWDS
jgi:hypothetical protein